MSLEAINRLILASGCFSGASVGGWTIDPTVIVPLVAGGLLYAVGIARLWHSAGPGRGASFLRVAFFALGWLMMATALVSPLHHASRSLFTWHMVEHELVMTVAAPLLVLSRPLGVLLWAFPSRSRRGVASIAKTGAYLVGWDILSRPLVATLMHAAAIWLWHIPAAFDAALGSELLHWLQHLSFLVTALFFWWSMLANRRRAGMAVGQLFLTGLQTGALGVLLAMAPRTLYPAQAALAAAQGIDPLVDQQLAGLIMWVPAGIVYVAAGLVMAGWWIVRSSEEVGHGART